MSLAYTFMTILAGAVKIINKYVPYFVTFMFDYRSAKNIEIDKIWQSCNAVFLSTTAKCGYFR